MPPLKGHAPARPRFGYHASHSCLFAAPVKRAKPKAKLSFPRAMLRFFATPSSPLAHLTCQRILLQLRQLLDPSMPATLSAVPCLATAPESPLSSLLCSFLCCQPSCELTTTDAFLLVISFSTSVKFCIYYIERLHYTAPQTLHQLCTQQTTDDCQGLGVDLLHSGLKQ